MSRCCRCQCKFHNCTLDTTFGHFRPIFENRYSDDDGLHLAHICIHDKQIMIIKKNVYFIPSMLSAIRTLNSLPLIALS